MGENELARRGTDPTTEGSSARLRAAVTMDRPPRARWMTGTGSALVSAGRLTATPEPFAASAMNRFVAAGELFDLEYAGAFIRIWCRVCDKFEHLADDQPDTVDAAQSAHRCGARTSDWNRGDLGVRV